MVLMIVVWLVIWASLLGVVVHLGLCYRRITVMKRNACALLEERCRALAIAKDRMDEAKTELSAAKELSRARLVLFDHSMELYTQIKQLNSGAIERIAKLDELITKVSPGPVRLKVKS